MTTLRQLLTSETVDMTAVQTHLDGLTNNQRIDETRSLGRAQLANLFSAAGGHRRISLNDIVPADQPSMSEVVHHGKNSLGAFTQFAKVFVRPESDPQGELWGYNRNSSFLETVVGPGYFVAYPYSTDGEVLVDYLRTPPAKPDHWPEILSNAARLSMFVYNGTQDVVRGVSEHVNIGRATKKGKPMSAWFILCKEA